MSEGGWGRARVLGGRGPRGRGFYRLGGKKKKNDSTGSRFVE